MSIFDQTETTLTKEQELQTLVTNIKQIASQNVSEIKSAYERLMFIFWQNDKFTPQEVFDAIGTDSAQLFSVANATIQLLAIVDPTYVPKAPTQTFTINQDGTVTTPAI